MLQQGFLDMQTNLHSYTNWRGYLFQFRIYGHKFPSPSLASFVHRESAVTL